MYSVYVINKSSSEVYIRVQREKLCTLNQTFTQDLLDKVEQDNKKDIVSSYLMQWGFCLILPKQTLPFAIHVPSEGPFKYASLFAAGKLWALDFEMNFFRYGCLFIKSTSSGGSYLFNVTPANPEPVWFAPKLAEMKSGIPMYTGLIKASTETYLGRTKYGTLLLEFTYSWKDACVRDEHGKISFSVELLHDTGHEFVRAKAGDPIPPNTVMTSVSKSEGSLFLGRVGGNTPCTIACEDDKIKSFCYGSQKVPSGEVLVLIDDPSIN